MKAKLLRRAGKIPKGAEVEILAKVGDDEGRGGEAVGPGEKSPSYAVKDGASHEETVDTRDLKPSLANDR